MRVIVTARSERPRVRRPAGVESRSSPNQRWRPRPIAVTGAPGAGSAAASGTGVAATGSANSEQPEVVAGD